MRFSVALTLVLPTYPQHNQHEAACFLKDKAGPDYTLNPTTRGLANGGQFTRLLGSVMKTSG
jgi:hypothetical protein